MAGEAKKLTKEERMERKRTLAEEWNTRVLKADIPDAHRMLDMTAALNKAVRVLRHQLGFRISFEKGTELLRELRETEMKVNETTKKICEAVGINYRPPRSLAALEDTDGDWGKGA